METPNPSSGALPITVGGEGKERRPSKADVFVYGISSHNAAKRAERERRGGKKKKKTNYL